MDPAYRLDGPTFDTGSHRRPTALQNYAYQLCLRAGGNELRKGNFPAEGVVDDPASADRWPLPALDRRSGDSFEHQLLPIAVVQSPPLDVTGTQEDPTPAAGAVKRQCNERRVEHRCPEGKLPNRTGTRDQRTSAPCETRVDAERAPPRPAFQRDRCHSFTSANCGFLSTSALRLSQTACRISANSAEPRTSSDRGRSRPISKISLTRVGPAVITATRSAR